jgi:hypothetical protein
MGSVCMRVFIGVSDHTCMSIYVCTVFLKNAKLLKTVINITYVQPFHQIHRKSWIVSIT